MLAHGLFIQSSLATSFAVRRFRTIIEAGFLPCNPLHECLDLLISSKSFDGMKLVKQFAFSEGSVDLAVTDVMQPDCDLTLERLWNEMMLRDIDSPEFTITDRTKVLRNRRHRFHSVCSSVGNRRRLCVPSQDELGHRQESTSTRLVLGFRAEVSRMGCRSLSRSTAKLSAVVERAVSTLNCSSPPRMRGLLARSNVQRGLSSVSRMTSRTLTNAPMLEENRCEMIMARSPDLHFIDWRAHSELNRGLLGLGARCFYQLLL